MEKNNFFEKHKTLFVLFGFCSILLMVFSAVVGRGLFSDLPSTFLAIIDKQANNASYYFYHEIMPNNFSCRLLALPYNIFGSIFGDNPLSKLNVYTFSCMFMTFAATCLNFLIAKRTQKYVYAGFALLFYALFTIPASIYPVDTTYISIPMFLILLQYFFTEEKISKVDYIIIILLSGYMLQSSPNMIIPCSILGLEGVILLAKKHSKHWKVKSYITLTFLLTVGYMLYKTFFYTKMEGYTCPTFQDCYWIFRNSLNSVINNFATSDLIFSSVALIFLIYALIRRKELGKIEGTVGALVSIYGIYSIYEFTKFVRDPFVGQRLFALVVICFIVLVFGICVFNLFKKKFDTNLLANSLVTVACFCGIIQCLIQYGGCLQFSKYADFINEKVNNNVGIVRIATEDYQTKPFLIYDSCYGTLQRSLLVSDYDLKSIMFPSEKIMKGDEACLGDIDTSHINDESNKHLILQYSYISMNNKYWKLSNIVPLIDSVK